MVILIYYFRGGQINVSLKWSLRTRSSRNYINGWPGNPQEKRSVQPEPQRSHFHRYLWQISRRQPSSDYPQEWVYSFILRPSHHTVSITWLTSVSTWVDRGGEGPRLKERICAHIRCFEQGQVRFSLHEHLKCQCLGQKLQDKASSLFFRWETPPPPLCLPR